MKTWIVLGVALAGCQFNKSSSSTGPGGGGGGDNSGGGGGDQGQASVNGAYPDGCINESGDPTKPCWSDYGAWKARDAGIKPAAVEDDHFHVTPWGGPMSEDPKTCDDAANHCIRGGYFNVDGKRASPAFLHKDQVHAYSNPDQPISGGRLMYVTVAGTAQNLHLNREVIVLDFDPNDEFPASEKDALTTGRWSKTNINTIDPEKGELEADGNTYPFRRARAVVEIIRTDSEN